MIDLEKIYKKIKEDMVAASGEGASSSGLVSPSGSGITQDDILGDYDPEKGVMGQDNFYIPKKAVKHVMKRWEEPANGGSVRKPKNKKTPYEKGLKTVKGI